MLHSKFIKLLISILNWQVNSPSNFASLFILMTHNSPVNFKLTHFLVLDCGTCSGENFPNSSCLFGNYKSVCLQLLNQFSVQSNITRLYLFSSNIMYYGQKQPIKKQNFDIFKCSTQNSSNYSCQFWIDKSIPLQILRHSSFTWHITPL